MLILLHTKKRPSFCSSLFQTGDSRDQLSKFLIMGVLLLKKISLLLLLLISASVVATVFAGRPWKFMDESAIEASTDAKELPKKPCNEESIGIHIERMLKVNTKDYGSYDPAPTFRKPPFKLIPN